MRVIRGLRTYKHMTSEHVFSYKFKSLVFQAKKRIKKPEFKSDPGLVVKLFRKISKHVRKEHYIHKII